MEIRVGVIKGNGIGPEIMEATLWVLEATGLKFRWVPIAIGDEGVEKYGHPLPQESVKALKEVKIAIKSPLLVDKFKGRIYCEHEDGSVGIYPSLNNAIRRELELFMCPRPIRGVAGISGPYEKLDIHILREVTEDVYSGIEHMIGDEAAECVKLTTRKAALRAARYAFDYARRNGRKKVTCVHKANAVSMTDGLFLKCFREAAAENPDIPSDDYMVDAAAYYMAKCPEKFDVVVASNQYGDILSDLAAGLVGSLGGRTNCSRGLSRGSAGYCEQGNCQSHCADSFRSFSAQGDWKKERGEGHRRCGIRPAAGRTDLHPGAGRNVFHHGGSPAHCGPGKDTGLTAAVETAAAYGKEGWK